MIKELDMQLRKLTTAMLVMGLSAGLAHAEDGALYLRYTYSSQKMARLPLVAPWTRSLKMA
ncbi:hypothetical protein LTSEALA_1031 [Salmonella enterica subsp. enterica serovar Alachua str. R6-377]|uniref:Uncharacterized protein n=1 Tax=Salmonella enterica subsp. enterica serovar Alachua str. R6-377 TaxID=913241 RepID=G5LKT9_SALET|nr:hypothetical protein LTSEALA_1031 [Salmonella enterica subsp. enterica serovar Alachua str. R6-377]